MDNKMSPADLAAMRVRKGRSDEQMYTDARDAMMKKRMAKEKPSLKSDTGDLAPGVSMSDESKKMMRDTDAGYDYATKNKRKGGAVKYAKGGSVSSASKRADGCAVKGKTKGRMV